MKIVVVRHGKQVKVPGRNGPLTEGGWAAARQTGRWLASQGLNPVLLIHTGQHRTRQTAEAVLEAFEAEVPLGRPRTLPSLPRYWHPFTDELTKRVQDDGDVILVGHHPTQQLVESYCGGRAFGVPKDNKAAAFVLEHTDSDGWCCVSVWPGASGAEAAKGGA